MARQVFAPPPDDDDIIDVLAGRVSPYSEPPPKPTAAPSDHGPAQPPAAAGAPITAPELPPAPQPKAEARRPVTPRPMRAVPATQLRQPKSRPAAAPGPLKRVGLYFDLDQWARLNELQIERARKSQAQDYTAIVIEALEVHYGGFERKLS